MNDFEFYLPTRVLFGRGTLARLGAAIAACGGTRVLLVYGKNSIKQSGLYDQIIAQLAAHGLDYVELAGVDPNPRLASVKQGAALCRQHGVDFVLAVGGGSSIDCAKGIAAAALDDGDPWDFWAWKRPITRALPLGTVLTLAATGSEMNDGCVITNEDTREKHGASGPALFPRFSILDPTHTYSVSRRQTASGTADIMTHVYEFYFSHAESAYLQNGMAEAVLKTCVKYGPIACEHPDDYEARANLMWAGSMALNGVVSEGLIFDGFNHTTEHAVSAIYDLTHGVGLAILATHWMEYILGPDTVLKFVAFARNVWGVSGDDAMAVAREGILRTRAFYQSMGLPTSFSEVDIDDSHFDEIIAKTLMGRPTVGQFRALDRDDLMRILQAAL